MTSFFARWGRSGVPRAIEAVWRADERRLAQWTCRAAQQKQHIRCYNAHEGVSEERDLYEQALPKTPGLEEVYWHSSDHPDIGEGIVSSPVDVYTRNYSERRSLPSRSARFAARALRDLDYKFHLHPAIELNNLDLITRCLIAASVARDEAFLHSISNDDFSKILQALAGEDAHIHRLESVHRGFGWRRVKRLDMRRTAAVAYEYARIIEAVYAARHGLHRSLSLQDYTILLCAARDLGQQGFARRLWDQMHEQGCAADVHCWNAYIACSLSQGGNKAISRKHNQAKPFHIVVRKMQDARSESNPLAEARPLETARNLHREMLQAGVAANVDSHIIMITAAARDGDLETVEAILKNVWGMDIERLMQGEDDPSLHMNDLDTTSALYPTQKLLIALIDAYCINRKLSQALKCIDAFAQRYDIEIELAVWERLLEMTFVVSIPRTGKNSRELGISTRGRPANVESLWRTMVGAPYFVKPNMRMYNHLIKSLYLQKNTMVPMLAKMEEAEPLYQESLRTARGLQRELGHQLRSIESADDPVTAAATAKLRDDFEYFELVRLQNRGYINAWVKLLLGATQSRPAWGDYNFSLRVLPGFLLDWLHSVPTFVRYETEGGMVEFQIRDDATMLASAQRRERIVRRKISDEDAALKRTKRVTFENETSFAEINRPAMPKRSKRLVEARKEQDK